MKVYKHKTFPELEAQIAHEWHKEYRDNNYILMCNRTVILVGVKDKDIENHPFWVLQEDEA